MFKKTGQRFAAITLQPVVRAKVKAVHMCAMGPQKILQRCMNGIYISNPVESQRNSALIADHNHPQPGLIELSNRLNHTRKEAKLPPTGHIASLWHLFIQNAVAIEENGLYCAVEWANLCICHSAMIAIAMRADFSYAMCLSQSITAL